MIRLWLAVSKKLPRNWPLPGAMNRASWSVSGEETVTTPLELITTLLTMLLGVLPPPKITCAFPATVGPPFEGFAKVAPVSVTVVANPAG